MAGMDVRDILELEEQSTVVTKDSLFNDPKKKKVKKNEVTFKKPDGMHRELWGLLWTDQKNALPIIPTDTQQGYKQMKAKIGQSRVRPWKWMPFTNPARKDNAVFYHWRRGADEGKEYPFARFHKQVDIATYSDLEYQQHLHSDEWSKAETDYLFQMARRYDLRFIVIHDRWDREEYPNRSIEDLKERYYGISNALAKLRSPEGTTKQKAYDADHERRRKDQLIKLFNRTVEQVEEEEQLMAELKKIEQRKREREKKTQDLQKLISQADSNIDASARHKAESGGGGASGAGWSRKQNKKKLPPQRVLEKNVNSEGSGIKFPDYKSSGVSLRSMRMKLPASVGQKKTKAIEQVLNELGLDLNPTPTEEICTNFNELRQDIVLLYELKLALINCEYELQTLRHRYETLAPGRPHPDLGAISSVLDQPASALAAATVKEESPAKVNKEEPEATTLQVTPQRKRKAALEQGNVLKKLKQKL